MNSAHFTATLADWSEEKYVYVSGGNLPDDVWEALSEEMSAMGYKDYGFYMIEDFLTKKMKAQPQSTDSESGQLFVYFPNMSKAKAWMKTADNVIDRLISYFKEDKLKFYQYVRSIKKD